MFRRVPTIYVHDPHLPNLPTCGGGRPVSAHVCAERPRIVRHRAGERSPYPALRPWVGCSTTAGSLHREM